MLSANRLPGLLLRGREIRKDRSRGMRFVGIIAEPKEARCYGPFLRAGS